MKYNFFTRKSPKVSEIGFGAWQLGNSGAWSAIPYTKSLRLIETALELGINFFDTAPGYGLGDSENILGEVLSKTDRSKIVISTKFGHNQDGRTDYSAENIRPSLEGSLRRLKTDYVDSLLIHNPPKSYLDGNVNKQYDVLEQLKYEGKILEYGASLDTAEEITEFIQETNGKVVEAFFNIIHQDSKNAFNLAKTNDVGIIVKIPLDSGWLSGKYNASSKFDDLRSRWSEKDIKIRAELVEKIKSILNENENENIAQAAIAFCLSYPGVSTVIPGTKNIGQLQNNLRSIDFKLEQKSISELEKLYENQIKGLKIPW
ncbi:MAG: aldo/keto reductase [Melioribacteraceae bacterium]|nr:aldo/keto reductase [Melioribacteraceae bacterium]